MSLLEQISQWVHDPPPAFVFEFSQAGIAFSRNGEKGFMPFEPGTLVPSPVHDNIQRMDAAASALARLAPNPANSKKPRPAVLILPDYAARVSVLDFDSFPSSAEERLSLVRFRLKKTLPFDVDSAAVSYFVQPQPKDVPGAKFEVVAAAVALEVIAKYETLCRAANLHPGEITTSALAALNLYREDGPAVIAKLGGRILTVMVVSGGHLKLVRCLELEESTEAEVLSVIHPTLAYLEDELSSPNSRLILCGFADGALGNLSYPRDILRSKLGQPDGYSAGMLGYLEGAKN
jgi:type IV pilus assembly protein PilM